MKYLLVGDTSSHEGLTGSPEVLGMYELLIGVNRRLRTFPIPNVVIS